MTPKTKILIVDDEAPSAVLLKIMLKDLGYAVVATAESADAAVRAVEATVPDLVLMDIRLCGERDGIDVAEEIRRRFRVPVVFLTAFSDRETIARAGTAEPVGYLVKPYHPSELRSTIEIGLVKHRTEQKLRAANELLEDKVRERTAALSETVKRLQEENHERMRMARELEGLADRYRSIADASIDVIFRLTPDGRVSYVSPAVGPVLGFAEKEVVGVYFLDFVHDDDRPAAQDAYERLLRGERVRSLDLRIAKNGGDYICGELNVIPIRENGCVAEIQGIVHDVTVRRRLQSKIEQQAVEQEMILENTLAGIVLLKDRRIIWVNSNMEQMFGLSRQEAVGMTTESFYASPEKFREVGREAFPLLAQGNTYHSDHLLKRKDGSFLWCSLSGKAVDPAVPDAGSIWLIQDISERKNTEEALRSAHDRLRFLLSASPSVIYTCGYGGNWATTFMSENLKSMLGYESRENLETPGFWISRIHPDDRDRVLSGLKMLEANDFCDTEYRFLHKNGTYRWMLDSVQVIRNEAGDPLECVGSWMDISGRKQAEEELARYKIELEQTIENRTAELKRIIEQLNVEIFERMKTADDLTRNKTFLTNILDSIQDGILVVDQDRKIMLANRAMTEWFPGMREIGFRTHTCGDVIHRWGRCDHCIAEAAVTAGAKRSLCCERENLNGRRSLEVHAYPLVAPSGAVMGSVEYLRDVTEQKHLEENLAAYQEQLRSLNYRIAVSEKEERRRIAQDLHDSIPQTLAFCKMKIQQLRSGLELDMDREAARDDCAQLSAMIDGAIAESRDLMFKLAPPVLYELGLVPAIEQLLRRISTNHNIECIFHPVSGDAPYKGEIATILYGMVLELVNNVVKHAQAKTLIVGCERTDEAIVITVEDDGDGLPAEDNVSRYKNEKGGFGLFSIGERTSYLNGSFRLQGRSSGGTVATLRVPQTAMMRGKDQPSERH